MNREPPSIRVAVPAERAALEALQWRASLANAGDRDALLQNPDAVELPLRQIEAGGVFVAEAGTGLAGFAAVLPRADGDAELDGLFVEPALWGRGIGEALVLRCVVEARSMGAKALHVIGNPHARGFYLKCGFALVGETHMRFGIGLLMRLDLR